ncbi:hypothetical protein SDC9_90237 [bioreactor metagenome]|uniref:Uncharacterized protein n=1 Tax=bioreactor metagenome TaxID=1076179 RepID=A0A644ZRH0_9ZZZZ
MRGVHTGKENVVVGCRRTRPFLSIGAGIEDDVAPRNDIEFPPRKQRAEFSQVVRHGKVDRDIVRKEIDVR